MRARVEENSGVQCEARTIEVCGEGEPRKNGVGQAEDSPRLRKHGQLRLPHDAMASIREMIVLQAVAARGWRSAMS
jgi:hypothetical protein